MPAPAPSPRAPTGLSPDPERRLIPALMDALLHHPGPAVPLGELSGLVRPELDAPLDPEALRRTLDSGSLPVRVLEPRNLRWPGGLKSWVILLNSKPRRRSGARLSRHLSKTLSRLGQGLDASSVPEMARWERLLHEEQEVRRVACRWLPPREPETLRTTTPPLHRRRRARARARGLSG